MSGGFLPVGRLVDLGGVRQLGRDGRLADESLGVAGEGGIEHVGAGGVQLLGVAVVDGDEGTGRPAVIFGQRGKLRAEGPFLSLLAEFERQLSNAGRLVVIGYSFRDDHVNEIIRRWTADDIARQITVVDPDWDSSGMSTRISARSSSST